MTEQTGFHEPQGYNPQPEYQRPEEAAAAQAPPMSEDVVQRMIDQALERQRVAHEREMADLRASLGSAPRTTTQPLGDTLIPDHSGGIGQEIRPTWSLHEQQLAIRGEHPDQNEPEAENNAA